MYIYYSMGVYEPVKNPRYIHINSIDIQCKQNRNENTIGKYIGCKKKRKKKEKKNVN